MDDTSGEDKTALPALVSESSDGDALLSLRRDITLVGSGPTMRLRLRSPGVSRCHAALLWDGQRLLVRDLSRHANVVVNGEARTSGWLHEGDRLSIGPFSFRVRMPAQPPAALNQSVPTAELQDGDGRPAARLRGGTLLVGRGEHCDLQVEGTEVSAAHALVFELNGAHHVRDLNSRTGVQVNESPVRQAQLSPGDVLQIGKARFCYGFSGAGGETVAEAPSSDQFPLQVEPDEVEGPDLTAASSGSSIDPERHATTAMKTADGEAILSVTHRPPQETDPGNIPSELSPADERITQCFAVPAEYRGPVQNFLVNTANATALAHEAFENPGPAISGPCSEPGLEAEGIGGQEQFEPNENRPDDEFPIESETMIRLLAKVFDAGPLETDASDRQASEPSVDGNGTRAAHKASSSSSRGRQGWVRRLLRRERHHADGVAE